MVKGLISVNLKCDASKRLLLNVFMALQVVLQHHDHVRDRVRDRVSGSCTGLNPIDTDPGYMPVLEYRWYGLTGTCPPSGFTVIAF